MIGSLTPSTTEVSDYSYSTLTGNTLGQQQAVNSLSRRYRALNNSSLRIKIRGRGADITICFGRALAVDLGGSPDKIPWHIEAWASQLDALDVLARVDKGASRASRASHTSRRISYVYIIAVILTSR